MLALLLVALAPISWLFSVSSRSLLAVTLLHATVWMVALLFARRRLRAGLPPAARLAGGVWLFLFLLVSFQMATQLRPVLYRAAGEPLFAEEQRFFLQHMAETADVEPVDVEPADVEPADVGPADVGPADVETSEAGTAEREAE